MKKCAKCKKVKKVSEFYTNRSKRDGLDHYCKKCNRKRMRIYMRKRYHEQKKKSKSSK